MLSVWLWLLGIGGAYEVYTIVNKRRGDTLSELVWRVKHPLLPFVVGVIIGHWFWTKRCEKCDAVGTLADEESEGNNNGGN